jgi:hypothetical protein
MKNVSREIPVLGKLPAGIGLHAVPAFLVKSGLPMILF